MKPLLLFYSTWLAISATAAGIILFSVAGSMDRALLLMYAALLSIIMICVSGGIVSVLVYNSIYIVAVIHFLIVFIITMFVNRYSYSSWLIFPSAAALLTLIPALLTRLVKYSFSSNFIHLRFTAIAFVAIIVLTACYFAIAFCSTWAFSPFKEECFYKYPIDNTIMIDQAVDLKKSLLLNTNTKEPYTGAAYVYKKQLKVDFTQPKITAISYYINGRYVGSSVKPASRVQDLIELDNRYTTEDLPKNVPKLIHKNYEKMIKDEIKSWGKYIVFKNALIDSEYSGYYGTTATYEKEGRPYKSDIRYHANGVISVIKSYSYDKLDEPESEHGFDYLGYCSYNNKYEYGDYLLRWNSKDFIYTDKYTDFILLGAAYIEEQTDNDLITSN